MARTQRKDKGQGKRKETPKSSPKPKPRPKNPPKASPSPKNAPTTPKHEVHTGIPIPTGTKPKPSPGTPKSSDPPGRKAEEPQEERKTPTATNMTPRKMEFTPAHQSSETTFNPANENVPPDSMPTYGSMMLIPNPPTDGSMDSLFEYLNDNFIEFFQGDPHIMEFYATEVLQVSSLWELKIWIRAPYPELYSKLGIDDYLIYRNHFFNLRIIWDYIEARTSQELPMSYNDFLGFRGTCYAEVCAYYPENPSEVPPTHVFASSSKPKATPPPYTKVSPVVAQGSRSAPNSIAPGKHAPSVTSYHTTPPAMHYPAPVQLQSAFTPVHSSSVHASVPVSVSHSRSSNASSPMSVGSMNSDYTSRDNRSKRRAKRHKAVKARGTLSEKVKWNCQRSTFDIFKNSVIGHLLQVGAGYMVDKWFIANYREQGEQLFSSKEFWDRYMISPAQARHDKGFLFGLLTSACKETENKTLIKFEDSRDGILAWHEFVDENSNNGSTELRVEQLERSLFTAFNPRHPDGVAGYVDKFQTILAKLEGCYAKLNQDPLNPIDKGFSDIRKKRILLSNLATDSTIKYLVQHCRQKKSMDFEDTCRYLSTNTIRDDGEQDALRSKPRNFRGQTVNMEIDEPTEVDDQMSMSQVKAAFNATVDSTGIVKAFRTFTDSKFRESLNIPTELWKELAPQIQEEINKARKEIRLRREQGRTQQPSTTASTPTIPPQYPTMATTKAQTIATLVDQTSNMAIEDDEDSGADTDDDELMATFRVNMVKAVPTFEGEIEEDIPTYTLDIYKSMRKVFRQQTQSAVYAISDGGADTTLVGKHAYIKRDGYTGRHARVIGYDPSNTTSHPVPIVTAYVKVMTPSNIPVILEVNEAPYIKDCPITLISEYQVREFGLPIDSVATKHRHPNGQFGMQRLQLNEYLHIPFEDRGGTMGFELLPIESADFDKYETITITCGKTPWNPNQFREAKFTHASMTETVPTQSTVAPDPPIGTNMAMDCIPYVSTDDISRVDTLIHAHRTVSWHRIDHKLIDPKLIQPYLGFRPLRTVVKTLEKTTQNARMEIRAPMRRHYKARLSHLRPVRLDEIISTDALFANCKCLFYGHTGAYVYYGMKSHCITVIGFRRKGEFPQNYRDFIRLEGAPSALRRDNAMEEKGFDVDEIQREFCIKDQWSEPHYQNQNPVEGCAIRLLKQQSHVLMDRTGAPPPTWYFAVTYLSEIHNLCSDPALPGEIPPYQFRHGHTLDISAYLLFQFWSRVLYLDPESTWPNTKERSGRWLGVAHNIGDPLTFWILDDQSKQVIARSVVRPYTGNKRVHWDKELDYLEPESTGQGEDTDEDATSLPTDEDLKVAVSSPVPSVRNLELPTLDTTKPMVKLETDDSYDGKSKLRYSNLPININPDISRHTKSAMEPYPSSTPKYNPTEVKYKVEVPDKPSHESSESNPRRSRRDTKPVNYSGMKVTKEVVDQMDDYSTMWVPSTMLRKR